MAKKIIVSEAKIIPFLVSTSKPVYKKKYVNTKSKLGTTKPVKSVSSKKVKKWGSTTTTYYPIYPWPKESWWKRIIDKLFFWLR